MDISLDVYGLIVGIQQLQRELNYRQGDVMLRAKMENVNGLDYMRTLSNRFEPYSNNQVITMKEQMVKELEYRLDKASIRY